MHQSSPPLGERSVRSPVAYLPMYPSAPPLTDAPGTESETTRSVEVVARLKYVSPWVSCATAITESPAAPPTSVEFTIDAVLITEINPSDGPMRSVMAPRPLVGKSFDVVVPNNTPVAVAFRFATPRTSSLPVPPKYVHDTRARPSSDRTAMKMSRCPAICVWKPPIVGRFVDVVVPTTIARPV